jgi:hypothetical protein
LDYSDCTFLPEDYPVTLHVVLANPDRQTFVWATDRWARLGLDGYSTVEKITHLKEQKIACSIWGDQFAMHARNRLIDRIKGNPLTSYSSGEITVFLREFGAEIFPEIRNFKGLDQNSPRGILLAVLGTNPRLYRIDLCERPIVVPIFGQTAAGDESNQALIFTNYYYERCQKSLEELLFIGIHTVHLAEHMNTKGIRGVDAWTCEDGKFQQLTSSQVAKYIKLSESLDASILEQFRNAPASE